MPTLSTIIPAYNDLPGVLTALNSLHALQRGDSEYIVQDDASPACDFPALIPASLARAERNPHNLGFAGNANNGAKRASGDILFFVNQDVYGVYGWSEGWDTAILNAFADPAVGIVGARLLFPNGRVQSAGGLFDARCTPIHRCFTWANPHYHEVSTARDVSWVTGAALAIRREIFERVGGFDTRYLGGYFEDTDLCAKVRELGCKIRYEPSCTLIHRVGSAGGGQHFTRNALLFKSRWVDSGKITPESPAVLARYW